MTNRLDLATCSTENLIDYVQGHGWWAGNKPEVQRLTGGVSGTVLRLQDGETSLVIKQARRKLDVPDTWCARPERILTEANALKVLSAVADEHVPQALGVDPDQLIFAMAGAPREWRSWKTFLLAGTSPQETHLLVKSLATQLYTWHVMTTESNWPQETVPRHEFANTENFLALRVKPFYYDQMARLDLQLQDSVSDLAESLLTDKTCLIHGDVSPKNILTSFGSASPSQGDPPWWLIDSECAVLSHPVFDVAFMITHLLLKSVSPQRKFLTKSVHEFWDTYLNSQRREEGINSVIQISEDSLIGHVCVFLMARVAGISKVDYLTSDQARRVYSVAIDTLQKRDKTLTRLISELQKVE